MRIVAVSCLVACLLLTAGCKTAPKGPDPLPVRVLRSPAQTVLSRTFVGPYMDAGKSFESFMQYVTDSKIVPQGDLSGVWFDDPEKVPPEKTRYEIRIPVAPGTGATAPYVVKGTPEMLFAGVILMGPYERLSERYGELSEWVLANGYVPVGPIHEVYLIHPGSGVPPDKYETEVYLPIFPAPAKAEPAKKR